MSKKKLSCHCGSIEAQVEVPENGFKKIHIIDLDAAKTGTNKNIEAITTIGMKIAL